MKTPEKTINRTQTQQRLDQYQALNNNNLPFSFTLSSEFEGPHIVLVGALHGNEIAGVEACWRFFSYLQENKLNLSKGKLTFVIGNPEAYREGLRFVDENLNRAFLDIPNPTLEGERVLEFRSFFDNNPDITALFDLHSVSKGDFNAVIYPRAEATNQLVEDVNLIKNHFIFQENHIPGLLLMEAINRGFESLVFECGNHSDPKTIEIAYEIVLNIIRHYGLLSADDLPKIPNPLQKPKHIKKYTILEPIKPNPNFTWNIPENEIFTDYFIKKHQIFAFDDEGPKIASQDCILVIPDPKPSPKDTDAGFLGICEESVLTTSKA